METIEQRRNQTASKAPANRALYIPKSVEMVVKSKSGAVIMYLFRHHDKPAFKGFIGRRGKPSRFNTFGSPEARDRYAQEWFVNATANVDGWDARKREERETRRAGIENLKASIKIGDLFNSTISYSMTLNQFYQVVAIDGLRVALVRIGSEKLTGGGYSGDERAVKVDEVEAVTMKRIEARIVGEKILSLGYDGHAYSTTESETHYYNTMD